MTAPTLEAVLEFLKSHPDVLVDHPEIMESLTLPPSLTYQGQGVVDMSQAMVAHLQKKVTTLKTDQEQLVKKVRGLQSFQSQIHAAVESLLAAYDFDMFVHVLTKELPLILQIDAVSLCSEAKDLTIKGLSTSGIHLLPEGFVDITMGPQNPLLCEQHLPAGDMAVFSVASTLVQAHALVRLKVSPKAPVGLLALGSRIPGDFNYHQAEQNLIFFLARVVEAQIRRWLDLPAY